MAKKVWNLMKDHKAAHEAERIIKFAEANVPGYSVARG